MPTYADELRRLADLLDKDFRGNILKVIEELGFVINSLARQAAQQSVQADNNRIGDFWNCPKCEDLHGVENNSCGCGYRR